MEGEGKGQAEGQEEGLGVVFLPPPSCEPEYGSVDRHHLETLLLNQLLIAVEKADDRNGLNASFEGEVNERRFKLVRRTSDAAFLERDQAIQEARNGRPVLSLEPQSYGKIGDKRTADIRVRNKGGAAEVYGVIDYFRLELKRHGRFITSQPIVWAKKQPDARDPRKILLELEQYCDFRIAEMEPMDGDTFLYAADHWIMRDGALWNASHPSKLSNGARAFLVRIRIASNPEPVGSTLAQWFEVSPIVGIEQTDPPQWVGEIDEKKAERLRDMRGV